MGRSAGGGVDCGVVVVLLLLVRGCFSGGESWEPTTITGPGEVRTPDVLCDALWGPNLGPSTLNFLCDLGLSPAQMESRVESKSELERNSEARERHRHDCWFISTEAHPIHYKWTQPAAKLQIHIPAAASILTSRK
jgi:hypothetical protein